MTKEQVFQMLSRAITHISENFCFDERESQLDEQINTDELPFEYSIESGVSKAVILIKGVPFVIKMPFFKIYSDEDFQEAWYQWDSARDNAFSVYLEKRRNELNDQEYCLTPAEIEYVDSLFSKDLPEPNEEDFNPYYDLIGASDINLDADTKSTISDWDYCNLECVIYQLAVEEGLGAYFAEEGCLGIIDKTPVYYQTRCTPRNEIDIDYNSKEYQNKRKKSETICNSLDINCFDELWIADFIDCYGIEEFKRLNNFLDRYGINDLRPCNIGYLDGAPILFDYSGYRDW